MSELSTVYYAHHLWKYNTPIEEYEIGLIIKAFPNVAIINPNTDIEQGREEAKIMCDCLSAVSKCDAVVFSDLDGAVGKGVYEEVGNANRVYWIHNNAVLPFDGTFSILPDSGTRRIYATVNPSAEATP